MKPDFVSEEDYERLMALARADLEHPEYRHLLLLAARVVPIGASGLWLREQLAAADASDEETNNLCFAHGQACFPNREPWQTAAALLKMWREGRAPKSGPKFAEQLLTGDVSDLPSGGARLVKKPMSN